MAEPVSDIQVRPGGEQGSVWGDNYCDRSQESALDVTGVWEQMLVGLGRLHLGEVPLLSCDNSLGEAGYREGSVGVQIGSAPGKAGLQNMMDCFHCAAIPSCLQGNGLEQVQEF